MPFEVERPVADARSLSMQLSVAANINSQAKQGKLCWDYVSRVGRRGRVCGEGVSAYTPEHTFRLRLYHLPEALGRVTHV